MVEQWSSKSHVWVRFLLPLLQKYRFQKRKYKPIKIFNKKKSRIINLNKKFLIKNFKFSPIKNYTDSYTFYLLKKSNIKNLFSNNYFNFNSVLFLNKFFIYNNYFRNSNKSSLSYTFNNKNLFFKFYSYNNKSLFLFYNIFVNFFSNIFFYNIFNNFNFIYFYLYYLNNSNFLIKNKNKYYFNLLPNSNFFKSSNNFFFKSKSRFPFKKIYFKNNIKKPSKYELFNFLKIFKFKNILISFRNKLYKASNFFMFFHLFSFSLFHYKNMFSLKLKKKNLEVFQLTKNDWVNNNLAKLTKYSFRFEPSDVLHFKLNYDNFKKHNILPVVTVFDFNDTLLENDFFFFSLSDFFIFEKNDLSFSSNYFWNLLSLNDFLKINYNDYFIFFKLIKNINRDFNNLYLNDGNNVKTRLNFYNFFNFNKFEFITFIFFNSLFYKYVLFLNKKSFKNLNQSFSNNLFNLIDSYFYSTDNRLLFSNLLPSFSFNYVLKKRIIKIFSYSKFSVSTTLWQYNTLLRFLEFCSGKKVCLKFFNFLGSTLTFNEKAQCLLWSQKVKYFRKVLGPRLFLNESLQIMLLALKLKDPYFLSNWMVSTMYKISFWKYKMFLRYLKYVLRYFFWVIFKELKVKGIKFQLKGKISVAGNARTRTVFHNVGFTSHTTFNNKILYHLNLVRSFTGVMGLKLWIVF